MALNDRFNRLILSMSQYNDERSKHCLVATHISFDKEEEFIS